MIGRNVYRIFFRNSSFFETRGKQLSRENRNNNIKFQSGLSRLYFSFINNIKKSSDFRTHHGLYGLKLFAQCSILYMKHGVTKFPLCVREHSIQIVKVCTQQCEFVLAHRFRRGQQIFSLYSKLWEERALKDMVMKMKQQFTRKGKELFMGIAGVSAYNWEKMRIPDNEILEYVTELENVYELKNSTVICQKCHQRVAFDAVVEDIDYCPCDGSEVDLSDWIPFLERKDLIVWRKEEKTNRGLYAYKVYGSYNDVTAFDFLSVQLDTEYRKEWDSTAVQLTILDSDPSTNSDVIYWVMQWPRMFSNRDYVFNRRFKIDEEKKVMVVVNKCTEHPGCPEKYENIRVKKYWSTMVIRPHTHFNEPGIEFCLTYFDDPGVSIPSAITSWVAFSGLPDFLMRVREAARQLAVRREQEKITHSESKESTEPLVGPPVVKPSDESPKTSVVTAQPTHPESKESYLQLNAARLFL